MTSFTPIEAFMFLVQDTEALAKNQGILTDAQRAYLEAFRVERLVPIYKREERATRNPFTLCFVGLTNVGKSTLIEALLDAPIAPRLNGPATAVTVEYSFSERWELEMHHHDASVLPVSQQFDEPASLAAEVARHVIYPAKDASKIASVAVRGPMELLRNDIVLADTPGIGAAVMDSMDSGAKPSENALSIAQRWLQIAGRAYMCVATGVAWKISPEETEFYRSLRHICSNIIITKWEDGDAEQQKWKATFGKLFPGADFDFVNARRGVNVPEFREIIEAQSSLERRLLQTKLELKKAWRDLNRHFKQVYQLQIPWRADSLKRFRNVCAPHAVLHTITTELKQHV